MKRKYLDDIGVIDRPDNWGKSHSRKSKQLYKQQRETYGFDQRETWSLYFTYYLWLYERLKMYLDVGGKNVDLSFHKFIYKDKEYTLEELIMLMLSKLEYLIGAKEIEVPEEFKDDAFYEDNVKESLSSEVNGIWNLILPAMWW